MLILSKKLWETDRIIKIHFTDNWTSNDTYIITDCILNELKELIIEAKNTKRPGYIICDCTKGEIPPFTLALKVAKFMAGIHDILVEGLVCTIMYVKLDAHKLWIDRIQQLVTPARPLYMVEHKKDIKKYINLSVLDNTGLV